MRNKPAILFLTGASGAGKTTVLASLEKRLTAPGYFFLRFDSIGVPSFQEMIDQAGSLERWQEMKTHHWVEKIVAEYREDQIVLLEGQSNPDFIEAALQKYGIERSAIVLLDCDWETMKARLTQGRQQPELANDDMKNWADFLRAQAKRKGISIIDTAARTPDAIAEMIETQILSKLILAT